jgi:Protein of unknown function (DUF3019)
MIRPVVLVCCALLGPLAWRGALPADVVRHEFIELELRPRLCTLSAKDERCDTVVRAEWRSRRNEALCLLIVGHPDVKQCWENHSQGTYSVALVFDEDLVVELRDAQLRTVLVAQAVTVIREALQLRRKRRQPWSIF